MKKTVCLIILFFCPLFIFSQTTEQEELLDLEVSEVSTQDIQNKQDLEVSTQDIQNEQSPQDTQQQDSLQELKEEQPVSDPQEESVDSDSTDEEEAERPEYISLQLCNIEREEINRFREMYLQEKWTQQLRATLENAIDYRLYVRNAITEAELPPELEYLPVVESNYRINAKSKSGALGLWQFMENSVKPFLTLNDYEDERLDPWKSTDAAVKKLKDNYNIFGDWLIAIAAYNCGAGAMTRIIKKAGSNDFWYLVDNNFLPKQTAAYVPKLLAIADLATNSEYYNISIPNHNEEYEALYNEKNGLFDYLEVQKAYSLSQLASEMRIDAANLKKLNPSFTKGFTHPSHTSKIRLPLGMEQTAKEALAKISPIEFPFKYKVEAGDSLWSISRRYGVTVQQLCDINGIEENAILKIGKILYIPSK